MAKRVFRLKNGKRIKTKKQKLVDFGKKTKKTSKKVLKTLDERLPSEKEARDFAGVVSGRKKPKRRSKESELFKLLKE